MLVQIQPDADAMSRQAAEILADVVRRKPAAVLGLATGSTPIGTYRHLVRIARDQQLDFSRVTTFNLDEYEGLPASHPQSYHAFMWEHLFEPLGLRDEQTNLLDGLAREPAVECLEYEQRIRDAGGIDVQLLGIGSDGHIAFCEPGCSLSGRSGVVALHPQTIGDNSRFFDDPADVPQWAFSVGVGTILEARCCLILASGANKADAWSRMIEGPVTTRSPASALQLHPWVVAISDEAAASKLQFADEYQRLAAQRAGQPWLPEWIFRPELEPRPAASGRSRVDDA